MIAMFSILAASIAALPDCRAMRVAKPVGAIVSMADSVEAVCPAGKVAAKLRYDTSRKVALARTDLVAGEPLGRVYLPPRPDVLPGEPVRIIVRIGNVLLYRDVTALQPAHLQQSYFARDDAGHVLRAPRFVGEVRP